MKTILAFLLMVSGAHATTGDINGDGQIGLEETIYSLQVVSGAEPQPVEEVVGTEITSLPYTISSSGFYFITNDLTCANTRDGISVNADNVTIDLMGFSLIGTQPPPPTTLWSGIRLSGASYSNSVSNIEIRNGTIRNFSGGGIIYFNVDGGNHRIFNLRVIDNGVGTTIGIGTGDNSIVEGCSVSGSGGGGIHVREGSIVKNNITYNNSGRGIQAGAGSTIIGNTSTNNTSYGIAVLSGCQ